MSDRCIFLSATKYVLKMLSIFKAMNLLMHLGQIISFCFKKILSPLESYLHGHFNFSLSGENNFVFPRKEVWGSRVPLRTCFFAWEAVWGKILTVDILMKRGWQMVNRCNFCKESEEAIDHILIHCTKTRELWIFLLALFGVAWVFQDLVRNLLLQWKVKGFQKKNGVVWHLAPICLFWCVWKERNRRIFKDEELSD